MNRGQLMLNFIHENLFYISTILLLLSFPYSESLLSIATGFLLLQLFFTEDFNTKWNILITDRSLWALCGIFFIYLIGCFFCKDASTGWYELKKTIFWLIVPLGVALSRKLSEKRFWLLLFLFVIFVTVSTIVATYKIINQEQFQITNIREASYVSHVSFSFQIILSLFILAYGWLKRPSIICRIKPIFLIAGGAWLIFFLILQKSLIGIISFYFSVLVFGIWIIGQVKFVRKRTILIITAISFSIIPFLYVGYVFYNFYTIKDVMPTYEKMFTSNGNRYSFNPENLQKENGHYVNWYICNKELEQLWNQRSQLFLYDNDATGYQVYYTLIRYLTSKGLKKDAQGVSSLTDQDIVNIEKGISNYIFVDKKYSLYPRIYQTIWELDEYRNTGNPNNQSLSQRFEYIKAAIYIIQHNFWGIGTGNYKLEYANAYDQINTRLDHEFRFHVHNQYLGYMVKFGIIGLILIISLVFYSIYHKRQFRNILMVTLLVVLMISSFGEAILETHVGLPFFLFFISLFLWHSPNDLTHSMSN